MTTGAGILTPEGIVVASDLLKVRQKIADGKVTIIERTKGCRKIIPSSDQKSLVVYACQLGFQEHLEWLEELISEIMQSAKTEQIPAQLREAVSRVLMTDELGSIGQYGRSVTEFQGLLASVSGNKYNLAYQYLAHPHKAVTGYMAIGSGSGYAASVLRNCNSITEAVQVAEASIKEAARHRKSLSKGLNIYSLDARDGIKEVKYVK